MGIKFCIFVILFAAAVTGVFGQSGRRATAKPTPAETAAPVKDEDPEQYSESIPHGRRNITVTDRFPGMSTDTKKTSQATVVTPGVSPAPTVTTGGDDEVLKVETNLVTIPVSVFDRNGLYIPGLRRQDFKIYEDGAEQEIAYFGAQDKPFTVCLMLDVSPSTAYKIEEIRRSAMAFVDKLEPQDKVIVIEFDHSVYVRTTEPTNDRQKIYDGINKARFGDGTSLYNAVDEALRKQLGPIQGRKAVVLFTDGVDTTSRKNTYDSTVNYAEESDSLVFPIYFNTYFDNRAGGGLGGINGGGINGGIFGGGGGGGMIGSSAEDYALGKRYLDDLADVTGGRVFRPEATPGGLSAAFEGIAEELRRQYSIGYVPANEGRPGQRKTIKVRVNRPNLVIRARDSYVVGANTTPAPTPTPAKQ